MNRFSASFANVTGSVLLALLVVASSALAQEPSSPEGIRTVAPEDCIVVVPPEYPRGERHDGIEGTVEVLMEYDEQGWATRVSVRTSSGNKHLDKAALKAVKQWRVNPRLADGRAIAGVALIPIKFRLE